MVVVYTTPNSKPFTDSSGTVDRPAVVQTLPESELAETTFGSTEPEQNITRSSIFRKKTSERGEVTVSEAGNEFPGAYQLAEEHKILIREVRQEIATIEVMLDTGRRAYQIPIANIREMGVSHVAQNDTILMRIFRGPLGVKTVFSQPEETLIRTEPQAKPLDHDYIRFKKDQLGLE